MAQGKPRLAVWAAGTLTLFAMDSANVFQQVATAPLANAGAYLPDMMFSEGDFLLVGNNRVAPTYSHASLDFTLTQIGLQTVADTGLRAWAHDYRHNAHAVGFSSQGYLHVCNPDTGALTRISDIQWSIGTGVFYIVAPDGMSAIQLLPPGNPTGFLLRTRYATTLSGTAPAQYPNYTAFLGQTFSKNCLTGAISYDNTLIYLAGVDNALTVHNYNFSGGANSISGIIQNIPAAVGVGTIRKVAVSPDDRFVAVSYVNAGVYTTKIFERSGAVLTETNTFANFGHALEWTGDGFFLIDGVLKRAYQFTGTFNNVDAIMVNLPATVTVAALSRHVDGVPGFARLYHAGAQDVAQCVTNLSTLKLALLTSGASFDANDATFSAVSNAGAFEVSGGGWTPGGLTLTGVTKIDGPSGTTILRSNPVEQILLTELTFRYSLLYDATTNVPLMLIDYLEDIVAPSLSALKFDFSSGALLYVPV